MSKNKITSYFDTNAAKKCKREQETNVKVENNTSVEPVVQSQILDQQLQVSNTYHTESDTNLPGSLDIGYFVNGSKTADDYIKCLIIKRYNLPESNICWPYSNHNKKGKIEKRYLRKNHLVKYPW